MKEDRCRVYDVDGRPVRVRGDRPLTAEGQAALADVVRAAQAHMAATFTPEMAERQAAARIRNRERLQRLGIRR